MGHAVAEQLGAIPPRPLDESAAKIGESGDGHTYTRGKSAARVAKEARPPTCPLTGRNNESRTDR